MNDNKERDYTGIAINGFIMLLALLLILAVAIYAIVKLVDSDYEELIAAIVVVIIPITIIFCIGFLTQQPNMARVMIFFGKYKGSFKKNGFFWINPFVGRSRVSLRIRNMDIEPIKVNDKVGNPVLIGMVLVWRVKDTYKVAFDLDSHGVLGSAIDHFVRIQSDAALREVTGQYAYDQTESHSDELTLRDGGEEINDLLERKINERLAMAGIEVVEARLNYLAYAPEIAAVMLRRQQASAIITAREKIVEGAVTMVEMALNRIEDRGLVKLDNERKAAMVSNLLVVLCADEAAQPVLNTSSN